MRSFSGFTDWGERETDIQLFTNIILIGGHITSQDECIIGAAALRATGLGEWCDTTGFSSQIDRPEPKYSMERAQVSYEASASEFFPLGAGKSLRFISHLRPSPLFDGPKSVKMSEEDIIELRFNDKISINDVLHETSIWQNFLTVALRKASYLDDLRLSIGSADTPESSWSLMVPGRRTDVGQKYRSRTEFLFTRSRLGEKLGKYLQEWHRRYQCIEMAILLFTGTAYDRSDFVHSKFLAYLQALEVLHRELFGGSRFPDKETQKVTIEALRGAIPSVLNVTLRASIKQQLGSSVGMLTLLDRLTALLGRYSNSLRPLFPNSHAEMKALSDVRNFLTHRSDRKNFRKDFLWSRELMSLSDRARLFMEICLLGALGMHDEEICELIRNFEPYVMSSYEVKYRFTGVIDR